MPGAGLPWLPAANAGWQQVKLTPGSPAGQRRWQIGAGGNGQRPLEWLQAGMGKVWWWWWFKEEVEAEMSPSTCSDAQG